MGGLGSTVVAQEERFLHILHIHTRHPSAPAVTAGSVQQRERDGAISDWG